MAGYRAVLRAAGGVDVLPLRGALTVTAPQGAPSRRAAGQAQVGHHRCGPKPLQRRLHSRGPSTLNLRCSPCQDGWRDACELRPRGSAVSARSRLRRARELPKLTNSTTARRPSPHGPRPGKPGPMPVARRPSLHRGKRHHDRGQRHRLVYAKCVTRNVLHVLCNRSVSPFPSRKMAPKIGADPLRASRSSMPGTLPRPPRTLPRRADTTRNASSGH